MKKIIIQYNLVDFCPLCNSKGKAIDKLSKSNYYFGGNIIPFPEEGIFLYECSNCSLLFKNHVPTEDSLTRVLSNNAKKVWKYKQGIHPAIEFIKPYIKNNYNCVIDIGAANGELIVQLKKYINCISAMDICSYPECEKIINGEYIVGNIEKKINWSGKRYDLVTAFDIFEHFIDAKNTCNNIFELISKGGRLILETGDWTYADEDLGKWYYANLFEHQIFWNKHSFEYMCDLYSLKLLDYRRVHHKNIRNIKFFKKIVLKTVIKLSSYSFFNKIMLSAGKGDPSRFVNPNIQDHAFVVIEK